MEDTRAVGILVVVVHTVVAEVTRKAVGVLHTRAIVVRHKAVRVEHSLVVAVEEDMPIVEVARRVVIAVVGIVRVVRKLAVVQALRTLVAEAEQNLEGSVVGTVAVGGIAARKVAVQTFKSSLVRVAFGSRDSFGATGEVVGRFRVEEVSFAQREPFGVASTKQETLHKVAASSSVASEL